MADSVLSRRWLPCGIVSQGIISQTCTQKGIQHAPCSPSHYMCSGKASLDTRGLFCMASQFHSEAVETIGVFLGWCSMSPGAPQPEVRCCTCCPMECWVTLERPMPSTRMVPAASTSGTAFNHPSCGRADVHASSRCCPQKSAVTDPALGSLICA